MSEGLLSSRKIRVQLVDDLSGDAQEIVRFFIEGTDYEIDLAAGNAAEVRGTLERYAAEGRRLRGRPVPGPTGPVVES